MNNENIIKVVERACLDKCLVEYYKSDISNSLYFQLSIGFVKYFFRVSDHKIKAEIKTFIYSKRTKLTALQRFVNKCIKKLETKSLYYAFNKIANAV